MILRDVSRGNIPCRSGIGEKNTDLSDAGLIAREADLRAVLPFDETVLVRGHETRHLVEEILLLNFHFSFACFLFSLSFNYYSGEVVSKVESGEFVQQPESIKTV